jgi:hypothetical protein
MLSFTLILYTYTHFYHSVNCQLIPCSNQKKLRRGLVPCIPLPPLHLTSPPHLCIPHRHRLPLSVPSPLAVAPGAVLSGCSSHYHPLRYQIDASAAPWGPAPPALAIVRPVVRRGRRTGSLPTHPSSGPPSSGLMHRINVRVVNSM